MTITTGSQTLVANNTFKTYVTQFHSFMNKSAEAVLEMGRVVFKANEDLSKPEFVEFCTAVRLNVNSSAISKLKTIGNRYDRLIQHKTVLPQAWTTLYHLARIDDTQFETGIQQHLIHQTMTANELKIIAPSLKGKSKRVPEETSIPEVEVQPSNDITIIVDAVIDPTVKAELLAELESLCAKFNCQIVLN